MNTSEKFYDRLTRFYPIIDIFLGSQKRKLFQGINDYEPGRILEIGVGNGTHLKYYTAHEVIGIDTSRAMLDQARKHLKNNIQLFHMNGEALSFPAEIFDYVILSHVIAVVKDPEKLLHEVYRVLKPNGTVFILNHFTPDNGMKYIDLLFERLSRWVHLKSMFHITNIKALEKFDLIRESNVGLFSYFKIMVYEKNQ